MTTSATTPATIPPIAPPERDGEDVSSGGVEVAELGALAEVAIDVDTESGVWFAVIVAVVAEAAVDEMLEAASATKSYQEQVSMGC